MKKLMLKTHLGTILSRSQMKQISGGYGDDDGDSGYVKCKDRSTCGGTCTFKTGVCAGHDGTCGTSQGSCVCAGAC